MICLKKYVLFFFLSIFIVFLIPISVLADSAASSIVMDLDSGRILYQNSIHEERLIASTTKIMTAIVALENGDLTKKVTVGDEILSMYGTNIYVQVGEKMKLRDLLYGLMLRSGNDASVVIAKAVAGSEKKFVAMMNKKAQEIGMENTHFENPHGLDEYTKNYSTAYDMALLSQYAYKNKTYRNIVSTKKYEVSTGGKTYLWYNRNELLDNYKYCTGGKNGYTPKAGKTLVTTASKNGLNLTVVTLSDSDTYNNHQSLYEDIFSRYQRYQIVDKNYFSIDQEFFDKEVYLKKSFYYPLTEDEVDNIKTVVRLLNSIGTDKVGVVEIYLNDQMIGKLPIFSKNGSENDNSNKFVKWFKSLF